MLCEFWTKGISIFRNNKEGFELEYIFPGSEDCYDAHMSGEGETVVYDIGNTLFIQEKKNGTYELLQTFDINGSVL